MPNHNRYNKPKGIVLIHLAIFIFFNLLFLLGKKSYLIIYVFISILYFSITYLLINVHIVSKKGVYHRDFRRDYVEFMFITVFISILFVTGLNIGKGVIDSPPPYNEYSFSILFDPQYSIVLNNLEYHYDFNLNRGHISYIIRENSPVPTKTIKILLPKEANIQNFSIKKESQNLIDGKDFNSQIRQYNKTGESSYVPSGVTIMDISVPLEGVICNFSISGKLIPNGKFRFYTMVLRADAYANTPINFVLGDYRCSENCFGEVTNAELFLEGNTINVNFPEGYYKGSTNGLQQFFTLNTYHAPTKQLKDNANNLYVSLIVSGIVLCGELIRVANKLISFC